MTRTVRATPTTDPTEADPEHELDGDDDTRTQLGGASLIAAFGRLVERGTTRNARTVMRARDLRGMTEDQWLA